MLHFIHIYLAYKLSAILQYLFVITALRYENTIVGGVSFPDAFQIVLDRSLACDTHDSLKCLWLPNSQIGQHFSVFGEINVCF